jgi:hypothetical protein
MVQVTLNTGLETLAAVTRESQPISTGKTVTVIKLDGPNLLVESKKHEQRDDPHRRFGSLPRHCHTRQ